MMIWFALKVCGGFFASLSLSLERVLCRQNNKESSERNQIFFCLGFQFQRQGVFRLFVTLPSEKERKRERYKTSPTKNSAQHHTRVAFRERQPLFFAILSREDGSAGEHRAKGTTFVSRESVNASFLFQFFFSPPVVFPSFLSLCFDSKTDSRGV